MSTIEELGAEIVLLRAVVADLVARPARPPELSEVHAASDILRGDPKANDAARAAFEAAGFPAEDFDAMASGARDRWIDDPDHHQREIDEADAAAKTAGYADRHEHAAAVQRAHEDAVTVARAHFAEVCADLSMTPDDFDRWYVPDERGEPARIVMPPDERAAWVADPTALAGRVKAGRAAFDSVCDEDFGTLPQHERDRWIAKPAECRQAVLDGIAQAEADARAAAAAVVAAAAAKEKAAADLKALIAAEVAKALAAKP